MKRLLLTCALVLSVSMFAESKTSGTRKASGSRVQSPAAVAESAGESSSSRTTSKTIDVSSVSVSIVKGWMEALDYECSIDEDGDIKCEKNGGKLYIRVDTERKLVKFSKMWNKPDDISVKMLTNLANTWNWEKVLLRVAVSDSGVSVADFCIVYNGGLNKLNFEESLDWFAQLCDSWVDTVCEHLD